jgi:hypothetical protein
VIPDAALAVIEAAYEESQRRGETARRYRQRAARELRRAGWTITPTGTARAPQTGAQRAA